VKRVIHRRKKTRALVEITGNILRMYFDRK
jgi:hypothetical protein